MFPYAYPVSSVFPQNIPTTSKASRVPTIASSASSRAPSIAGPNGNHGVGAARDMLTVDLERGETAWEETMGYLQVIDYRYTRFVWNSFLGKWKMIRDWRDPRWTSVKAIAGGLDSATRAQRKILFGENVIDIEGKGIFSLMVDEVGQNALGGVIQADGTRITGFAPFLRLPDRFHYPLVDR